MATWLPWCVNNSDLLSKIMFMLLIFVSPFSPLSQVATKLEHRHFLPWYDKWEGKGDATHGYIDVTAEGMQIAVGVPLQCDEPADFRTFRLGLFGLDKLYDVEGTLERLGRVVHKIL